MENLLAHGNVPPANGRAFPPPSAGCNVPPLDIPPELANSFIHGNHLAAAAAAFLTNSQFYPHAGANGHSPSQIPPTGPIDYAMNSETAALINSANPSIPSLPSNVSAFFPPTNPSVHPSSNGVFPVEDKENSKSAKSSTKSILWDTCKQEDDDSECEINVDDDEDEEKATKSITADNDKRANSGQKRPNTEGKRESNHHPHNKCLKVEKSAKMEPNGSQNEDSDVDDVVVKGETKKETRRKQSSENIRRENRSTLSPQDCNSNESVNSGSNYSWCTSSKMSNGFWRPY